MKAFEPLKEIERKEREKRLAPEDKELQTLFLPNVHFNIYKLTLLSGRW